jgi:uncharacterized protein YgbK (DUF1537 family)
VYKLVVLADDFTGALDTGVQFAKAGIRTAVSTVHGSGEYTGGEPPRVLVVNMETRHMSPAAARLKVRNIVQENSGEYYYKKTDSGLRGNIGAELEGLYGTGENGRVFFIPALPRMGRTTSKGYHYVDGVPVSRSAFGKDPFEPVTMDFIPDIIATQSSLPVGLVSASDLAENHIPTGDAAFLVFDAVDKNGLEAAARFIKTQRPRLMAGCAGFAEYIPEILDMRGTAPCDWHAGSTGLIVFSGSLHETTLDQMVYAEARGFESLTLTPEEKLSTGLENSPQGQTILDKMERAYQKTGKVILKAAGSPENINSTKALAEKMGLNGNRERERVAANLGGMAAMVLQSGLCENIAIFGGDTLAEFIKILGGSEIIPLGEISSGVVFSRLFYKKDDERKFVNLITKSGGFGNRDIVLSIADYLEEKTPCTNRDFPKTAVFEIGSTKRGMNI